MTDERYPPDKASGDWPVICTLGGPFDGRIVTFRMRAGWFSPKGCGTGMYRATGRWRDGAEIFEFVHSWGIAKAA